MATVILKYRDWEFEVDRELTQQTYSRIIHSGAETCICCDCKNYVAYRDRVFPEEIRELFNNLGVDHRKEVEITTWEVMANGLHKIGGWFHFKGRILKGKHCLVPNPSGGRTFDLTKIAGNFSVGFASGNDQTFFDEKTELVQIEFFTDIPWVIDPALEQK